MSLGAEDPEVKYKEEPSDEGEGEADVEGEGGESDDEGESEDEGEHLARVQTLIHNRNSD